MTTTTTAAPFDIPELRRQLSRYVNVKTACSCALVSKAWATTFTPVVWFEVDFAVHSRFVNLTRWTVSKNGHFIRKVKNARTFTQVLALTNPSIQYLQHLEVETTTSVLQHEYAYEVVSRNTRCLIKLDLCAATAAWPSANGSTNRRYSMIHYVSVPALVPFLGGGPGLGGGGGGAFTSKLKSLTLTYLCLTRHGFVTILQASPSLTELRLVGTHIVGGPPSSRVFHHKGVTTLATWLQNVVRTDRDQNDGNDGPSILAYFPSLKTLNVCKYENQWATETMGPSAGAIAETPTASAHVINSRIKEALANNCPNLTVFLLQDKTGAIIPQFLLNTPRKLSEITFLYPHVSAEAITAILQHQSSLQSVSVFCGDNIFVVSKERVVPVQDHFRDSGHMLQLIPRGCPWLEKLSLHLHEMDMDVVERVEWVCKGLKVLRVRVKGLDTEEKIERALSLWYAGLLVTSENGGGVLGGDGGGSRVGSRGCGDNSISQGGGGEGLGRSEDKQDVWSDGSLEARVARHLLQFEMLSIVWLGYKTWSLQ